MIYKIIVALVFLVGIVFLYVGVNLSQVDYVVVGLMLTVGNVLVASLPGAVKSDTQREACEREEKEHANAWIRQEPARRLEGARNAEVAGRFEDAARIYESLGMYEEAGRVRERKHIRKQFIVSKNISVDLNALLNQLKDGGMIIAYRCPHCGGNIQISGNTAPTSLLTCQYCGSALKMIDLVEYLKVALGA